MMLLFKGKAANPGETHVWADGRSWKKVGKKWVLASSISKVVGKTIETAQSYFDHSMATNLGDEIISILGHHGVSDFQTLSEKIKTGKPDTAHKIYKEMFDYIDSNPGTTEDKQAALHLIGTALVKLRDQFVASPKVRSTIKVKSHITGKEYARKQGKVTEELPALKATAVNAAKKKMGGWTVTGPLSTNSVREMLKLGTAKLVSGKIDAKRSWIMPKKAEDMKVKYAGDSLTIHVKQVRKVDQRTRATAKVDIEVPYAFAKAFLLKHLEGNKTTRNNFIFRMELSKGYRKFLEEAGAK